MNQLVLALFGLMAICGPTAVMAQQAVLPCVPAGIYGGTGAMSCSPISTTNPLPTQSN